MYRIIHKTIGEILPEMNHRRLFQVLTLTICLFIGSGSSLVVISNYCWIEPSIAPPVVTVFRDDHQHAFMLGWDDEMDDLRFSFIEDEFGFRHTSFVVTSRLNDSVLWGLDMLFRGHDIQSHSSEHLHFAWLNESHIELLLSQGIIDIERLYGYTPIVFAYPFGSHSSESDSIILNYFDVGRGIVPELTNQGAWPITNRSCCLHSAIGIHGITGNVVDLLSISFNEMINKEGHRAYKGYGHSGWFTARERILFKKELAKIVEHDLWLTTWGETIAYQIVRVHAVIENYYVYSENLKFVTTAPELNTSRYPIPITYKVEIPRDWNDVTVLENGRIIPHKIVDDPDNRYVLLNSVPVGQVIEITTQEIVDDTNPVISGIRVRYTTEGALILFEVSDLHGTITDVNMIVVTGIGTFNFNMVMNPTFWANTTYGRVVFNTSDIYTITVMASDSSGNIGVFSNE